jgi:hypothetical protein
MEGTVGLATEVQIPNILLPSHRVGLYFNLALSAVAAAPGPDQPGGPAARGADGVAGRGGDVLVQVQRALVAPLLLQAQEAAAPRIPQRGGLPHGGHPRGRLLHSARHLPHHQQVHRWQGAPAEGAPPLAALSTLMSLEQRSSQSATKNEMPMASPLGCW